MRQFPLRVPGRPISTRSLAALATAVLLVLVAAAPVLAHAQLISSDPADGSAVPFPGSITLTFDDALDPTKSQFLIIDGNGKTVEIGRVTADSKVMRATGLSLLLGAYQVRWTAVASDGDLTRGIVSFQVTASPTPGILSPAPGPTILPSTSPSASPTPSGAGSVGAASGDVVLPIMAALIIVGIAGLYLVRRGRRA